jgi:hypothetical protein
LVDLECDDSFDAGVCPCVPTTGFQGGMPLGRLKPRV